MSFLFRCCLLIAFPLHLLQAQSNSLASKPDYQNLRKYLAQAQNFSDAGDKKTAQQRLKYAQRFADKLCKQGHEPDLQSELSQLRSLTRSLTTPSPTAQSSLQGRQDDLISMSLTEFRQQAGNLSEVYRQVKTLLAIIRRKTKLSSYQQPTVELLDPVATCQQIRRLTRTDAAQKPFNQRQKQELQEMELLLQDLPGAMEEQGCFSRVDASLLLAEQDLRQAPFLLENAQTYLQLLDRLAPETTAIGERQLRIRQAQAQLAQRTAAAAASEQQASADAQLLQELPVAGMKDAALEQEFTRLAKPQLPANLHIKQAIITSNSWGINRDAVGRPIDRMMICALIEQDEAGNCFVQHLVFRQLAQGTTFGPTRLDPSWGMNHKPLDCSLL